MFTGTSGRIVGDRYKVSNPASVDSPSEAALSDWRVIRPGHWERVQISELMKLLAFAKTEEMTA